MYYYPVVVVCVCSILCMCVHYSSSSVCMCVCTILCMCMYYTMYVCVCMHACVCMYVCVHVCATVCMCMCTTACPCPDRYLYHVGLSFITIAIVNQGAP